MGGLAFVSELLYASVCLSYHSLYLLPIGEKVCKAQYFTGLIYTTIKYQVFLHTTLYEIQFGFQESLGYTAPFLVPCSTADIASPRVLPYLICMDFDGGLHVWRWHPGL